MHGIPVICFKFFEAAFQFHCNLALSFWNMNSRHVSTMRKQESIVYLCHLRITMGLLPVCFKFFEAAFQFRL